MSKPLPPVFPEPQIERFSLKRMIRLILDSLNLERGIFFTIWELIKNPGEAMHTYLFIDRKKYYDPLKFLLLTMAVYIFVIINFVPESGFMEGFEMGMRGDTPDPDKIAFGNKMVHIFQRFMNPIILSSIPLAALASRLIFRRFGLWFTEHLVLNAYLYSLISIFSIILTLVLLHHPIVVSLIVMTMSWGYCIYFFRSVFQISWWRSGWESTLVFILSTVFFLLFMSLAIIILVVTQLWGT